jgi:hypothetical protein
MLSNLSPTNYNFCTCIFKEKKNEEIQINPTKPKSTFPVEEITKISRQISEVT